MCSRILRVVIAIMFIANVVLVGCSTKENKEKSCEDTELNSNNEIVENKLEKTEANEIKDVKKITSLENDEYQLIEGIVYYVLVDEYLKNNDPLNPNASEFMRGYICYDGIEDNITPYTECTFIDEVNNVEKAKETLIESDSDSLKLPDNTIVSTYVKNKWQLENYDTQKEYHDKCPKDLEYEDLKTKD